MNPLTVLLASLLAASSSTFGSVANFKNATVELAPHVKATSDNVSYIMSENSSNDGVSVVTFTGDTVFNVENSEMMTNWAVFDPNDQTITALSIDGASGIGGEVSMACSQGELFVNGESQGFKTEEDPYMWGSIPVWCSGNRLNLRLPPRA